MFITTRIILISFILFPSIAFSKEIWSINNCQLVKNFKYGADDNDGKARIFFLGTESPQIFFKLDLKSSNISKVNYSFDNNKVSKRHIDLSFSKLTQRQWSGYKDLIRLENKNSFINAPFGLSVSRSFLLLFLSQNKLNINIFLKNGEKKKKTLFLNKTDTQFRKLASSCFKNKSSSYLSPEGGRKTNRYEGWNNGYGIYPKKDISHDFFNESFLFSNFTKNFSGTSLKHIKIYLEKSLLFKSKKNGIRENLEKLDVSTQLNESYNKYNKLIETLSTTNKQLISTRTKNSSLFKDFTIEKDRINKRIHYLEKRLKQSLINSKKNLEQKKQENETNFTHSLNKIKSLREKINFSKKNGQSIKSELNFLESLIAKYNLWNQKRKIKLRERSLFPWKTKTPLSIEEIKRQEKLAEKSMIKLEQLSSMESDLENLLPTLKSLKESEKKLSIASSKYRKALAKKITVTEKIASIERRLLRMGSLISLKYQKMYFEWNETIEKKFEAAGEQLFISEIETHEDKIKIEEEKYNQLKKKILSESPIFKLILCGPEKLYNRRLFCLTASSIQSPKSLESFIENRGFEYINRMIKIFSNRADSWNEFFKISKKEFLLNEIGKQVRRIDLNSLEKSWTYLSFLHWRIYRINALAKKKNESEKNDLMIDPKFYQKKYRKFLKKQQKLNTLKAELENSRSSLDEVIVEKRNLFRQSEDHFSYLLKGLDSKKFTNLIKQEANLKLLKDIMDCFIPSSSIEGCLSHQSSILNTLKIDREKITPIFIKKIRAIFSSSIHHIAILKRKSVEIMGKIANLTKQTTILEQEKVPQLKLKIDELKEKSNEISKKLNNIEQELSVQNQKNEDNDYIRSQRIKIFNSLTRDVQKIKDSIDLQMKILTQYCLDLSTLNSENKLINYNISKILNEKYKETYFIEFNRCDDLNTLLNSKVLP